VLQGFVAPFVFIISLFKNGLNICLRSLGPKMPT
jgi:hypothetical protein